MNVTAGCQIYSDVLLGEDVLFGPGSQTIAQESAGESEEVMASGGPFVSWGSGQWYVLWAKQTFSGGTFFCRKIIKSTFEHRQTVLSCRMNQVPGQKRCRIETNTFLPKTNILDISDNVFELEGK